MIDTLVQFLLYTLLKIIICCTATIPVIFLIKWELERQVTSLFNKHFPKKEE